MSVPLSPHPHQHLWLLVLTAILTSVRWCLNTVLTAFPWWSVALSIFSRTCWPSVCPCWKNVYSDLPIFQLDCLIFCSSCMSSLYILYMSPLSDKWFASIFSRSVGWLCILSVSVAEQMLFVVPLAYLCFTLVAFAFGVRSQKSLPRLTLRSSLPLFFSRSFMLSGLIYFELMFMYGVRQGSSFILLLVAVQFSQNHWRDCLYIHGFFIVKWPYVHGFLVSLFCSIDLRVCSYANTTTFWLR